MFPRVPGGVVQKCMHTHFKQGRDFIIEFLRDYQERVLPQNQGMSISYYKTRECMDKQACKDPYCPNYHFLGEKRRSINTASYSSSMCRFLFNCPKGDECAFAHTVNEVLYHPDVYKSAECALEKSDGSCLFTEICPYLHGKSIRATPQVNPLNDKIETQTREIEKLRNSVGRKTEELEKLRNMNCGGCKKPYLTCLQQGCSS